MVDTQEAPREEPTTMPVQASSSSTGKGPGLSYMNVWSPNKAKKREAWKPEQRIEQTVASGGSYLDSLGGSTGGWSRGDSTDLLPSIDELDRARNE